MNYSEANQATSLISRTCAHCFDHTNQEQWEQIGEGLARLVWAISEDDVFDATGQNSKYHPLLRVLRKNENGLLEDLISNGFLVAEEPK